MSDRLWFSTVGGMPIGNTADGTPIFANDHGVEVATELTNYVTDARLGADPTKKENAMSAIVKHRAKNPRTGFTLDDLEEFTTKLQVAGLDPTLPISARIHPNGRLISLEVTA